MKHVKNTPKVVLIFFIVNFIFEQSKLQTFNTLEKNKNLYNMKTKIYFLMCGLIFNAFSAQSFDTTFGTNGKLTQPNLGDFYSATEVAGGKVIAAGYNSDGNAVILKFLENGSMDTTFGINGKVVINQYTGSGSYEEAAIPVENYPTEKFW